MADLKLGTTIGGTTIWNQVNLPLVPSGDKILYKNHRIYTEADKPTSADVNALSKNGDTGTGPYTLIHNSNILTLQNKDAGNACYILAKDADGTNSWYIGRGSNNDTVSIYSYKSGVAANFGSEITFNKKLNIVNTGIESQGSIAYYHPTINRGLVLSANSAGYAELVRIGDSKSYEWNYGLRAYGNDDWRIGASRLYHQGFKPTAADVQALALTGGTVTGLVKSTVAGNVFETKGGFIRSNAENIMSLDGKTYSFVTSRNDAHLCQNAYWDGQWKKYSNSDASGVVAIINGELKFKKSAAGATDPNQYQYMVYHQGFKPTAADVGLPNVPNTVHSANADANTVAVRDGAADLHCRLVRATYGNETRIEGAIAFRVNNSTDNYMRFCSDPGAVRRWLSLDTGNSPTFAGARINGAINTTGDIGLDVKTSRRHIWFEYAAGSRVYMYADPNVNKLVVDSPVQVSGQLFLNAASGSGSVLDIRNWGNAGASRWAVMEAKDSQGWYWYCQRATSGGSISFAVNGTGSFTDVYISSDARLKSEFLPINNALTKVNKLYGKTYLKQRSLTDTRTGNREAGLIAQDLEKVLPEAVVTDAVSGIKTVSSAAVNALLVEAIKELTKRIEALENGRS